jgi:hypothetical protein
MAEILIAPDYLKDRSKRTLFLAGGISNCPDWQAIAIKKVIEVPQLIIMSPRRPYFDINEPKLTMEQITWEHHHLALAGIIMFWFAEGSTNPITLFEYGRWGRLGEKRKTWSERRIFVGTDPNYPRNMDVKIQTSLDNGEYVHDSLDAMLDAVKFHLDHT